MKKIGIILLVSFLANIVSAAEQARPGPHNKIGLTKSSEEDKKNTFFYKLFNDELNYDDNSTSLDNDKVLSQIEKLAELKERSIITEEEFQEKKAILLDKIQ
tara:strand:+ start:116 stop:421 length:306 start_codon:yes stop_codon:yes gene_type:complete